ncbi:PREDICTED: cytochrome P450 [Prunus dulcis]|uniref:PREDICTED: cytochrome P450 n=1 Tax=Prunus dulcis TaxID=3755 RepID=A0A5E4GF45_PRUDU|nr:premnaspirodiene oxygenase-like [Prunus dulcis]VVA38455.1 PREDICTED: cytochrome P450 [Prunus dulcis]
MQFFTKQNLSTNLSMDSSVSEMLQLPSFFVVLASFFFLLMLFKYWNKSQAKGLSKLPPGPKQLPIIGNVHQLIGALPHHAVTDLCNKHGPVMKLQLGEIFAVIISSPEAAKEVLKTSEISFAQRPEVYAVEIMAYDHSSIVFAPYNEYWRQLRKISVMELLSANRVRSFRSIREQEVWNLVEFIASSEGHTINLSDKIYTMTNDVVSRAAFGNKCKYQHEFTLLLGEIILLAGGFNIADLYPSLTFLRSMSGMQPALMKIQKKIDEILQDIVREHNMKREASRKSFGRLGEDEEDLLDTLLNYEEANKHEFHLTTDQIKAVTMDIFSAGSETSATTMEWAMSELLKNPRVMEKAQLEVRQVFEGKNKIEEEDVQKLHYLKLVMKETFRFHPPGPLIPREARERCEIGGYTIPAKTKILINAYAIGRDPKLWADPESFQPERFQGSSIDFKGNNFELLPFGAGRRICPGISFATSNIELGLAQLLYHFNWNLPNGTKLEALDMAENFGMTARRKNNLHLIATTYIPFNK